MSRESIDQLRERFAGNEDVKYRITRRAFEIYQRRASSGGEGNAFTDWIQAEQEIYFELLEEERAAFEEPAPAAEAAGEIPSSFDFTIGGETATQGGQAAASEAPALTDEAPAKKPRARAPRKKASEGEPQAKKTTARRTSKKVAGDADKGKAKEKKESKKKKSKD